MNNYKKDYVNRALSGEVVLTKFLDFNEQKEINAFKQKNIFICLEGGYEMAERKRAIISIYDDISFIDYKIKIYELIFESTFKSISHRHILGSIMSLGINRNSFGDILVTNDKFYLFVSEEISKYIEQNLKMVNNMPLILKEIVDTSDIILPKTSFEMINVPSLRLDAIVSKVLNKSRNDSSSIILKGLVFINHLECLSVSHNVKINDIISIRHFGRIEILEIVKVTKKDRLILKIGIKK